LFLKHFNGENREKFALTNTRIVVSREFQELDSFIVPKPDLGNTQARVYGKFGFGIG
jgi:hypothetical protein